MAKIKLAGGKKATPKKSMWQALPCLILIVGGIALLSLMFYFSLTGAKE